MALLIIDDSSVKTALKFYRERKTKFKTKKKLNTLVLSFFSN